jgi:hypothetical protein
MQPNSPLPPSNFSDNYLDQIASKPVVKTANPLLIWGMIGGVLILAVIGVIALASNKGGVSTSSLGAISTSFSSLKDVSEDSQKSIQSSELKTLNSSLSLVLTNANRDVQAYMKTNSIKKKDIAKSAAAKKVNTDIADMKKRLENARLNAVYDRTYAREMTFAIKTLRSDMAVLYKSGGKNLKAILETTDTNLKPLAEGFSQFNTD